MKQLKKTLLTLVALLAVTTGAWATDPKVYYSGDVDLRDLHEGDILMAGVNLIYTVDTWDGLSLEVNRFAQGGTTGTVVNQGVNAPITIGENGQIVYQSNTYTPVTEGGEAGDAWEVLSIEDQSLGIHNYKKVHVGGIKAPLIVVWNKAAKTGSFTMPGGNVTLEPDYYPQAALAAAPTAIPDVPATTDGAILNAGTVKKAIDNEMILDLQGTVMYYAAQVSGDAAPTAPDYDAEGWTEEVPTAANFAQGKVYVWYYIKGADGNGDEYIFSDSEITALGTEGYVTLAAEPTYAVTFADDTAEPTLWKAEPAADVKKGTAVTVTYTGTRKVIGVKAEKKAAAAATPALNITSPEVGQVIGSDGKNYDTDEASLPTGVTPVAKICYVSGSNGLALALTDEQGTMNWSTAQTTCAAHTAPFTGGTWKLATKDEWDNMISAAGSYSALRDGFSSVGGTNMQLGDYWSSTEYDSSRAWSYSFFGGWNEITKTTEKVVRAVLAF